MNSLKTLSFTTAALLAVSAPADAYFRAALRTDKEYRQDPTGIPQFRNGQAFMYVIDGIFTITGCALHPSPTSFEPAPILGCNIGSNGVVVDTLGNPDQQFYEIVGIEEASVVEPGRNDLVRLNARPPSDFPSVSPPVLGYPVSIFYDLRSITGNVRQYRLAGRGTTTVPGYYFNRPYTSRKTMEKELPEGVYQFAFPKRNNASQVVYLNFPVVNTVEGYVKPASGIVGGGFRFINVPSYGDGFAQYDARISNTFQWSGLDVSLIRPGDRLYVRFLNFSDPSDPNSAGTSVSFPPNTGIRILLDSPLQSSYTLPPGFFFNFPAPAPFKDKLLFEVILERDPGNGLAPVSIRTFQLPIAFRNTFPGAMLASFPENTPASKLAKDADPDGDGISNWIEWLSGTDPNSANTPRTLSAMAFVPPSAAKAGEPSTGYYEMTFPRLQGAVGGDVDVQSSTDLKTWTLLSSTDPEWKKDLTNPDLIRVISKSAQLGAKRYFRVALTSTLGQ